MKLKNFVIKSLAIYGVVRLAKDLTDFSMDDAVHGFERRMAHHVVEVIFDDDRFRKMRVEFSSEKEAREVLETLKDIQYARGYVTLEDLYDYVEPDRQIRLRETYFGWKTLNNVEVVRVKKLILDKYALIFDEPVRVC